MVFGELFEYLCLPSLKNVIRCVSYHVEGIGLNISFDLLVRHKFLSLAESYQRLNWRADCDQDREGVIEANLERNGTRRA